MHPRNRLSALLVILLAALVLVTPADALVKKTSPGKKATVVKKKTSQKTRRKKVPYIIAPKTPEIVTPETPHSHHFSPELSDALVRGDLNQAYHDLQLEEASDKVGYLINQVLMAQDKKPFDRGAAYHNLYLFLARQGRPAPKFVKEAAKYYQKVAKKTGYTNKSNILLAALYATAGDTTKSEKYFGKVDVSALIHNGEDYNGLEYLATYYAATKNTPRTLTYLDQAYQLNPGSLLQWLHVGDDFWAIEDDELFKTQVAAWKARHHQVLSQLQRDKSTHDARKKAALTIKSKKKKKSRR